MGMKYFMTILGGVLILAFQNCKQNGDISLFQDQGKLSAQDTNVTGAGLLDTDIVDNGGRNNDQDGTGVTPGPGGSTNPVVTPDPGGGTDPVQTKLLGPCQNNAAKMTDLLLLVRNVQTVGNDGLGFKISENSPQISFDKKTLNIEATADGAISQLRLVLQDTGNLVLFDDNSSGSLKTPSAQTSGLKIHLQSSRTVKVGDKLELKIESDLTQAVHAAGKKCILHPVLEASLQEVQN